MLAAAPARADVKAGVDAWSRGDYPRAVAEWRGPAIAGDADAEFNMGQAYKLGRGVPADLAQAEEWYRKAALQNHAQAGDNYALALFGEGRKADALPWLEKSVARDERRTELVLGTMLFNGDAGPKDLVRAYALVTRSSQQGLPQAGQTLAQMDGYLAPEQRQEGTALAARIAAGAGSAHAAAPAGPGPAPTATGRGTIARADLPPSRAPGPIVATPPVAPAPPRAAPPKPARPERPDRATPTPAGRFRVQLGAFRDTGNARALWSRVGARVGGRPDYVAGGGVTRLQAGPFASRAEAEHACRAAGTACAVLP